LFDVRSLIQPISIIISGDLHKRMMKVLKHLDIFITLYLNLPTAEIIK